MPDESSRQRLDRAARWRVEAIRSSRAALWPFVVSRAIVVGALALARFLVTEVRPRSGAALVAAHAGLLGWDANWYRRIAALGYGRAGRTSVRFFPLYPLLTRALSALPGLSTNVALLVIANLSTFVAVALIYRLVVVETGDEETASRAAWWLAIFPTAFVLSMGYADSLWLVTSLAMFLALRSRHFAAAAVAGLLAGVSRPVGVLLAVPALIEAAHRLGEIPWRRRWSRAAAVASAPVGTACYLAWSKVHDGSFFLPLSAQVSSQNRGRLADPIVTIARDLRYLVHGEHLGTALHAPWALFFVALLIVLYRSWPAAYGAYATVTLAVILTAPNLTSFERYGLDCFPFVLAVTTLTKRRQVSWSAFAVSGALLAGYALLTFLGAYIP
ncbi:MAG TPA: hypothetical protein VEH29_16265 [Acidimicrobiales bacterium]|nr:hypothetical protein [Acidimicrobiales bacterium]